MASYKINRRGQNRKCQMQFEIIGRSQMGKPFDHCAGKFGLYPAVYCQAVAQIISLIITFSFFYYETVSSRNCIYDIWTIHSAEELTTTLSLILYCVVVWELPLLNSYETNSEGYPSVQGLKQLNRLKTFSFIKLLIIYSSIHHPFVHPFI